MNRAFGRGSSENRVRPFVALEFETHTPPTRRTPLKRRNSGIHPLSPRASRSVNPFSLVITRIVLSIALTCHIDKFTVVAYLKNLPLCQALIEKELKFVVAPVPNTFLPNCSTLPIFSSA